MTASQKLLRGTAGFLALVAYWLMPATSHAHNPDTSYLRIRLTPEALETEFVFDVVTLVKIVPALDADGDHRLTRAELAAKAPAFVDFLREYVPIEINGDLADWGTAAPVGWPPDVGDSIAEQDYHAAKSLIPFTFRKPLEQMPEDVWLEFRFFHFVGSQHSVIGAISQPGRDEEVIFREFEPDYFYDTGFRAPVPTPSAAATATATADASADEANPHRRTAESSAWRTTRQFFVLGVEHIFLGYDHILFLLALIVVSRFRDLIKIVTSFTVAHTITLILATLEVVQVNRDWVEIAIAATIVYTAVENFWIRPGDAAGSRRWMLTFAFGLIHGFGFAGQLRELGLPSTGVVRALLSFNVGVEAGQLAIVGALYVPVMLMRQWRHGLTAQRVLSGAIALCGLGWLLDRLFGLGLMP
ncbi:MAG: hypothetical protein C0483_00390 [Pirellula sp.]|nr:hypothetical protein [Pirellula sp.]